MLPEKNHDNPLASEKQQGDYEAGRNSNNSMNNLWLEGGTQEYTRGGSSPPTGAAGNRNNSPSQRPAKTQQGTKPMVWRSGEDQQKLERFKQLKDRAKNISKGYAPAANRIQTRADPKDDSNKLSRDDIVSMPPHRTDLGSIQQSLAPFGGGGGGGGGQQKQQQQQQHRQASTNSILSDSAPLQIDLGTNHRHRKASLPPQARGMKVNTANNFGYNNSNGGADEDKSWSATGGGSSSTGGGGARAPGKKPKAKRANLPAWN